MAVVSLLGLTEAALRLAGLADFPVYRRDDRFGYIPQPDQSGAYLGRNRWVFNNRHMSAESAWSPSGRSNLLLIGNSIVLGGNSYDQASKIGPLLQSGLGQGCQVWPVAAGGWSTVNEMRFLQANPDIVEGTNFFIWELMAGQMGGLQPWREETQHPTRRPWWVTGYVMRKALMQRFGWGGDGPSAPAPSEQERHYGEFEQMLGRLTSAANRRPAGMIFLYPDQAQLELARAGHDWMDDRHRVEQLAGRYGIVLLDVAQSPFWTSALYKDGIHPTVEGNRILAGLLSDGLTQAGVAALCDAGAKAQTRTQRANGQ